MFSKKADSASASKKGDVVWSRGGAPELEDGELLDAAIAKLGIADVPWEIDDDVLGGCVGGAIDYAHYRSHDHEVRPLVGTFGKNSPKATGTSAY